MNFYKINYIGVKDNCSISQLKDFAKKDKESIEIAKNILKNNSIKKGEDEKIGFLLKKFYSSRLSK